LFKTDFHEWRGDFKEFSEKKKNTKTETGMPRELWNIYQAQLTDNALETTLQEIDQYLDTLDESNGNKASAKQCFLKLKCKPRNKHEKSMLLADGYAISKLQLLALDFLAVKNNGCLADAQAGLAHFVQQLAVFAPLA
jgi:hypothetical protein